MLNKLRSGCRHFYPFSPRQPRIQLVYIDIKDRRNVHGQKLGKEQSPDYGHPQRLPRLAAGADAEGDGEGKGIIAVLVSISCIDGRIGVARLLDGVVTGKR